LGGGGSEEGEEESDVSEARHGRSCLTVVWTALYIIRGVGW